MAKSKNNKLGKLDAWILLSAGKPDQIFTSDPNLKDYEVWRKTIKHLHGNKLIIKPCIITYSL